MKLVTSKAPLYVQLVEHVETHLHAQLHEDGAAPLYVPRAALMIGWRVAGSAQFLLALSEQSEQSALGTFSSLLPPDLATLLRSAVFFTGALFFARMALSLRHFSWFLDWIQSGAK